MTMNKRNYVFVFGGSVSGIGKGVLAASIARLFKNNGFKVSIMKIDPYFNLDSGTINPKEHGETYVTHDGGETDLDIGHYERFLGQQFDKKANLTSGQIFSKVMQAERQGLYQGQTIQMFPHMVDKTIAMIEEYSNELNNDITFIEIGGTIDDLEGNIYFQMMAKFKFKLKHQVILIHIDLLPYLDCSEEYKTKPMQRSVKTLNSFGIRPDIIICRVIQTKQIFNEIKEKIGLFCNITPEQIFLIPDQNNIYKIPDLLKSHKIIEIMLQQFHQLSLPEPKPFNEAEQSYQALVDVINKLETTNEPPVHIALIGKYNKLKDSYLSVYESLKIASYKNEIPIKIIFVDSAIITTQNVHELFKDIKGIVVCGGFGKDRILGKIMTCQYAREHNIPFLGLCLGMQLACIEIATNVCGLQDANS